VSLLDLTTVSFSQRSIPPLAISHPSSANRHNTRIYQRPASWLPYSGSRVATTPALVLRVPDRNR
jgi:hypothetical protein